jgi:hypothetical protein
MLGEEARTRASPPTSGRTKQQQGKHQTVVQGCRLVVSAVAMGSYDRAKAWNIP